MELYKEILINALNEKNINVTFPDLKISCDEIVKNQSYIILNSIREIIRDNSLNDKDCFDRIERIVCEFEKAGINCGSRHDF